MTQPARRLETVARPKQARSERTLYRILDAAEALIERRGLADTSIPEIVRRAKSSVGGFYARFKDKNELLQALEERFFEELTGRLVAIADAERWADASVAEIVEGCVKELVSVTRQRENLIRAFLFRAVHDADVRRDALRFRRDASERISALLLSRGAALRHPDPPVAIDLGVQVAFALMQARVLTGDTRAGGRELSDEELERELVRVFLRYVGLDEPATGSSDGTS